MKSFIVAVCAIFIVLLVNPAESFVVGGWKDLNATEVPQAVADLAIKDTVERSGAGEHALRGVGIESAKVQIVDGTLFQVEVRTYTTDCLPSASLDEVNDDEICPIIFYTVCMVTVYQPSRTGEALIITDRACYSIA